MSLIKLHPIFFISWGESHQIPWHRIRDGFRHVKALSTSRKYYSTFINVYANSVCYAPFGSGVRQVNLIDVKKQAFHAFTFQTLQKQNLRFLFKATTETSDKNELYL